MSATVKAHGLDGSLVAPDWPPLTRDEVCAVLKWYPELIGTFEIMSVSPRPLSAASVVEAAGRRIFIKRHARSVRDAKDLREEHALIKYLREHGACVPAVLKTEFNDTAIEIDGWTYEVHEAAAGLDLYTDAISWTPFFCAEHAHAAGVTMARLHRAAEGYDAPARVKTPLVSGFTIYAAQEPAIVMRRYIDERPALAEYMQGKGWMEEAIELLAPFAEQLKPLLPSLAPLWTHNDLHGSNLFWSDAGPHANVTAVIDWGLCDRANTAYDIGCAIDRSIVEWLMLVNDPEHPEAVAVHMNHLWAMLRGYESVRSLSEVEAHALAPMAALCHAEFALSEGEYFLQALHSPEKARLACYDYLVGHAQWWRGAGARVLDALRVWADKRETMMP